MKFLNKIIVLFLFQIVFCNVYSTEASYNKLGLNSSSWLSDFKGKIRLWRASWRITDNNLAIPMTLTISVTDVIIADDQYEVLKFAWPYPLRNDLTPNFEYKSYTKDNYKILVGNDASGLRAIIFKPIDISLVNIAMYQVFSNPGIYFNVNKLWDSEVKFDLEPINFTSGLISDFSEEIVLLKGSNTKFKINKESGYVDILGLTKDMEVSTKDFWENFKLIGFDSHWSILRDHNHKWDEISDQFLRILTRQDLNVKDKTYNIPRLIVGDVFCKRPNYPEKSYNQRDILLVNVLVNNNQRQLGGLNDIMPEPIKVIDNVNNKAFIIPGSSNPIISPYMEEIEHNFQKDFIQLITTDLTKKFPLYFSSLFKISSNKKQATYNKPDSLGASPFIAYDLSKRIKNQNKDSYNNVGLFDLLRFLQEDNTRIKGKLQKNNNSIKRKGYEPVKQEIKSLARIKLISIGLALFVLSGGGILYLIKRSMP